MALREPYHGSAKGQTSPVKDLPLFSKFSILIFKRKRLRSVCQLNQTGGSLFF